jgi:hypothetical protein
LADALEESGCNQQDILKHLREPGEHAKGCWALDLLFGKVQGMTEKPDFVSTSWQPANKDELMPEDYVRALESKLSALIDDKDVPGWTVNPAFDPEVNAFIQSHAHNAAFLKKAQSLQQNRARYFAGARAQESNPKRPKRVNSPQRDRFGHLSNAPPGQINAVLTDEPQTVEEIAKKCNFTVERVLQHFDTWFGTDRPLGKCLKRDVDQSHPPRATERYWLEEVPKTTKPGRKDP